VEYDSSHSSAEWVEEAPSAGRGRVIPLDEFGTVVFREAAAVRDGQSLNLAQIGARPMTMINGERRPLAIPSSLGDDGASFSVERTSADSSSTAGHARS